MIRKTTGVQCCAIIQASYIKRLYMFGALQTYTRWWTLQTYWQARVASTVWRSPPSPLGLAIAAAILASTRPAGPCCCNPCCANSVSLQRAMRADECQLHTAVCRDRKQPGAVQSATAGPRPSRRSLDTLRALHPPPMHPSPPPRNAERKDCKARRCPPPHSWSAVMRAHSRPL